jgi:hypothetical protein
MEIGRSPHHMEIMEILGWVIMCLFSHHALRWLNLLSKLMKVVCVRVQMQFFTQVLHFNLNYLLSFLFKILVHYFNSCPKWALWHRLANAEFALKFSKNSRIAIGFRGFLEEDSICINLYKFFLSYLNGKLCVFRVYAIKTHIGMHTQLINEYGLLSTHRLNL